MEQIRLELEEKQNAKEREKQERQLQIEVITYCTITNAAVFPSTYRRLPNMHAVIFFLDQKTKISSYIPVFETSHGLVSQLKVFVFNQDFF